MRVGWLGSECFGVSLEKPDDADKALGPHLHSEDPGHSQVISVAKGCE